MQITQCPIVYPSWKEFKNFYTFIQKIQKKYKSQYGMVKIVPPPEWSCKFSDYTYKLDKLNINSPIQQNIFGKGGIYQCLHIPKKSLTLKEYKQKTIPFDQITSGYSSQQIETLFWKNIVFSPPLYGADLINTLMDQRCGEWNLNNLYSVLSQAIKTDIRGVTTSYCYVGSWKTLFCWHKEDLDLSAINFLHEGKSKFWYSIPASQAEILEKEATKYFPQHFSKCSQHLRHKTTLINPYLLKRHHPNLQISKVQHKPGQFMIVFGGSYHCGFNFGFNIAEAINYGTLSWLNRLSNYKSCSCSKNSVRVSNQAIMQALSVSKFSSTPQFEQFKVNVEQQIQLEETENEKINIKSQITKKIKKDKKIPNKVSIDGSQYRIDNWILCDRCKIWRRVKIQYNRRKFDCSEVGKKCNIKQPCYNSKNMIML